MENPEMDNEKPTYMNHNWNWNFNYGKLNKTNSRRTYNWQQIENIVFYNPDD